MLLVNLKRSMRQKSTLARFFSQTSISNLDANVVQYPPILDMSIDARYNRQKEALHEKIKKLHTVEEKMIALNMPKYYGWRCVLLNDDKIPYNAIPLIQHYTRTHFVNSPALPKYYDHTDADALEIAKEIRPQIEDALLSVFQGVKFVNNFNYKSNIFNNKSVRALEEDSLSKNAVLQVNRIILNHLSASLPHLLEAQVDLEPRHEAFWFVGGVEPPKKVNAYWKKIKWQNYLIDRPLDRPVQFIGKPMVTLRSNLPLLPLAGFSDVELSAMDVPKYRYHPETAGYTKEYRHGTCVPGFWPGDSDEFGILSFQGRGHLLDRATSFGPEDNLEALHCQAMLSSFGWLFAQASYQGFTTFNDLTYPLTTQTVITDGRLWSMYAYQMNTMLVHGENVDKNPLKNICYGTQPMPLFGGIDLNGKLAEFDENVLKMLVQFYLNTPEKRDNLDLKPYLGEEQEYVADIEDTERRVWLENRYKDLVSNRPRHRLPYEVYHWEKIYKIDHNTRHMDKWRRPFELNQHPFRRRLNEHTPAYIPKVKRPYPKSKKKWENTYYPDV